MLHTASNRSFKSGVFFLIIEPKNFIIKKIVIITNFNHLVCDSKCFYFNGILLICNLVTWQLIFQLFGVIKVRSFKPFGEFFPFN